MYDFAGKKDGGVAFKELTAAYPTSEFAGFASNLTFETFLITKDWPLVIGYTDDLANCAATYDRERDHAIEPSGRVKSRWCYDAGDAMPGTYDTNGYYEAQWGYLLDSQPCYVMCVAELFDLTGDQAWLRGQKTA